MEISSWIWFGMWILLYWGVYGVAYGIAKDQIGSLFVGATFLSLWFAFLIKLIEKAGS